MARDTSSADPFALFEYARIGTQIDQELVSCAPRILMRLQDFEVRCSEPGCQVQAAYLGIELRSYTQQGEGTDYFVRQVGQGFLVADVGPGAPRTAIGRSIADWRLPVRWGTIAQDALVVLSLPPVPAWLRQAIQAVPWLRRVNSTPSGWSIIQTLATQDLNSILSLGSLLAGPASIQTLELAQAGGGQVSGLKVWTPLALVLASVEDFGRRLWEWITAQRERGGARPDQSTAPAPEEAASETRSPLGELMAEQEAAENANASAPATEQQEPQERVSPEEAQVESEPAAEPARVEWWWNVKPQSQHGLVYNGQKTIYGCAPTSVSMILNFWHARDPNNKTMSAQELLDKNVQDDKFHADGMSPSQAQDEVLEELGYQTFSNRMRKDLEALKAEVARGPVLAPIPFK